MAGKAPESSDQRGGWTAWPAIESPARTFILVLAMAVLAVLAGVLGGDVLWGLTAVVLLSIGLNRWFLPTTYEVDDQMIVAGYPLRKRAIRWQNARRLVLDVAGGWLSDARSGARGRRGIDLYWGPAPREARRLVARHARRAVSNGVDIEIVEPRSSASDGATEDSG